jgi:phosphatidate cytidylyltransferase
MLVACMLWYMLDVVVDTRPMVNIAVTMLTFVWVAFLGSFAALLLRAHNGRGLVAGVVFATVAADVAAYFVGNALGSHQLAPQISPGKTWEGVIGGGLGAIVVSVILVSLIPPWHFSSALKLGVVVAVVAPIGDLCESMIKRDLHLKDTGSVLPGHGGVFDRFDAMLFVLPATYYLVQYLRIH